MLKIISEHFAIISALITGTALFAAIVFLLGYLSLFDLNLVWIIAYSDILKFGLIGIGICSTILFVLTNHVDEASEWVNGKFRTC